MRAIIHRPHTQRERNDCRQRMTEEKMRDYHGYLTEAFSEASTAQKQEIAEAYLSGDNLRVGDLVAGLIDEYCTPEDWEVQDQMNWESEHDSRQR